MTDRRPGPRPRLRAGLIDLLPWVRSIRPLLGLIDPVAVALAGLIVRESVTPGAVLAAAVAASLVCRSADLHRSRIVLSVVEDLPRLALAAVVASLTLVALTPVSEVRTRPWTTLAVFAASTFVLLLLLRSAVYAVAHARRRSGRSAHPVVIVGAGAVGRRLAETFLDRKEYGLDPVGIIDTAPDLSARDLPVPLLGGLADLERVLLDLGVDDVVFAFPGPPDEQTVDIVRRNVQADRQVFVVPRFFEMMGLDNHRRHEVIGDVALVRLRRWGLRPHTLFYKRVFDLTLASVALLLLSPVLLACALAVRLETGPGVIFKQVRVGRGGQNFTLYKFRSLRPATSEESETRWSIDVDDRLGPVGRFLRRTSLDELPQLFNVLRGDMSLVGPRPERPYFVREFARTQLRYDDRHRMQAGLTGWAQVNDLRGDTSIDARVRYDNYYIENWSIWIDVKIMFRTLRAVLRSSPTKQVFDISGPRALPPAPAARELGPDRPPRVLHVSKPTSEGVAEVLLGYVRDQVARGWGVTVACPDDGWLGAAARRAGADVVRWEARRNPGPRTITETLRLRRVVRRVRPDVVHLHSAKAGLAGRLAVRGRRPTLYQPHAWSFAATRGLTRRATLAWERFGQRWTSELLCVSRTEYVEGERHGIAPTVSIATNGVDLARFHPVTPDEQRQARHRLDLPDAPTVVCVGRLSEQKGQHDLLEAWGKVKAEVPAAQLVLVGDGPDRDSLIATGSELAGVHLAGNQADVRPWLAAADVVAAPSRWEGMPVAPIEAMAAGRSVVATRITGMVDTVPAGAGALVEPGDTDHLARALVARLLDPALAAGEGARGRAHVESHHDAFTSARAVARILVRQYARTRGDADALVALGPLDVVRPAIDAPAPSAKSRRPA